MVIARWAGCIVMCLALALVGDGQRKPTMAKQFPASVSKRDARAEMPKQLVLNAEEVKQLVRTVLETDLNSGCRHGKCTHPRAPLVYTWAEGVPPVLVVQLTGVRAPLPVEMEWISTFGTAKGKRTLTLKVLIVSHLTFTKRFPWREVLEWDSHSSKPVRDGEHGPVFYIKRGAKDHALEIEAAGRTLRGLAVWLAVGHTAPSPLGGDEDLGCTPRDPNALLAAFTLYDGSSIITPDQRYWLELKRDAQGNWQSRLRGSEVYL